MLFLTTDRGKQIMSKTRKLRRARNARDEAIKKSEVAMSNMSEAKKDKSDLGAMALLKNAIISGQPNDTVIDIFESDMVLYSNCEFRNVAIKFGERVNIHALHGCLLRDCEIIYPPEYSKSQVLLGYNAALGCKFNGEEVEDFRTNSA